MALQVARQSHEQACPARGVGERAGHRESRSGSGSQWSSKVPSRGTLGSANSVRRASGAVFELKCYPPASWLRRSYQASDDPYTRGLSIRNRVVYGVSRRSRGLLLPEHAELSLGARTPACSVADVTVAKDCAGIAQTHRRRRHWRDRRRLTKAATTWMPNGHRRGAEVGDRQLRGGAVSREYARARTQVSARPAPATCLSPQAGTTAIALTHVLTGGGWALGRGSRLAGVATTSHPRCADDTTPGWSRLPDGRLPLRQELHKLWTAAGSLLVRTTSTSEPLLPRTAPCIGNWCCWNGRPAAVPASPCARSSRERCSRAARFSGRCRTSGRTRRPGGKCLRHHASGLAARDDGIERPGPGADAAEVRGNSSHRWMTRPGVAGLLVYSHRKESSNDDRRRPDSGRAGPA